MKRATLILAVLALLSGEAGQARAGLIYTSSPVGSWSYSYGTNAGHGYSSTYYPTSTAEYQTATFQGYISYNQTNADGSAYFGPIYDDPGDTFHIFTTYVTSTATQIIGITIAGDDGHSLFVNDEFVEGGGFGSILTYDLMLNAGVSTELQLAGYNGPGGWVFGITAPDSYRGVTINATVPVPEPSTVPVPEPSTLTLFAIGAVGLLGYGWRRRKLAAA